MNKQNNSGTIQPKPKKNFGSFSATGIERKKIQKATSYCHESKLAIELDGNYHNEEEAKEYDVARTKLLEEYGIRVSRFGIMK